MKEITFLIKDDPEGGYVASALGQSIFTQAETWEELHKQIRDAVGCHFEEEKDMPKTINLHYVRDEIIAA
jgi:predicted RNase H-like HicB family nuclease